MSEIKLVEGNCSKCLKQTTLISEYKYNILEDWPFPVTKRYICHEGCKKEQDKEDDEKWNYCQDCGRYNHLYEAPACADGTVGYGLCCIKYVCQKGCKFLCQNNHWNKIYENEPHLTKCNNCGVEMDLCIVSDYEYRGPYNLGLCWWGMLSKEWLRRYD